jgi:ATP-dependent helicase/nuclease subunit B
MRRKTEQPFLPFEDPGEPLRPAPNVPSPEPQPRPAPLADPAPPPASRLVAEIARVCAENPLEEKVLVVPSLLTGHTLVERLAREGHPWINLRVATARTLALDLAGPALAREGKRLVSRAQALALVEHGCARVLGPRSYFGELRKLPGLHRALQRTLDELRATGIGPAAIPASAFSDPRKPREIRAVLRAYEKALAEGGYVDGIDVLRRAVESAPAQARPVRFLAPGDLELSELERRLLEAVARERLEILPVDSPESWPERAAGIELVRAIGEENEIREIFRRVLASGAPLDDFEILHTDEAVYPALIWELSREHGLPVTFGSGIPVTYSRPGQAALAFLSWIEDGFAADRLREALAAGALTLRTLAGGEGPGARAVARSLRRARVGWGRRRHTTALERVIAELEKPERPSRRDEVDEAELKSPRRLEARARLLAEARAAKAFVTRALELAPSESSNDVLRTLARGAERFISEFARVSDELDGAAKLALETLFREIAELPTASEAAEDAAERLREAVRELAVMADRPRAGRLHVAAFDTGGHSGRRRTFLVGLDETRHPGRDLEDPVLLDEERRKINEALAKPLLGMERERPRQKTRALQGCVARLRGSLTASYSRFDIRNLSQAGEPSPSPFFLELYRARAGRPEADYGEMLAELGETRGFVPPVSDALDETEWWLAELRRQGIAPGAASAAVRARYPWLGDGRAAADARSSDAFTHWDGRLKAPSPELDPRRTDRPISASSVQSLAQCPFSYFLRSVLRVEPVDDLERDVTRWLEPRDEGSLLHEVFREFLEGITRKGEKPDTGRHLDEILRIAGARIEAWRERVPPSSAVAFEAQREAILTACRTFLASESAHCRDVTPRWFEVAFGLRGATEKTEKSGVGSEDPVEIALPGGQRILLRGSIDRVDETPDGSFHVWDYKTGSAAGVQEGRGIYGGRQAQPALYALALESLLARSGRSGRVSQSGYFFPGRKGEGQRMTIPVDAQETGNILAGLFDLAAAGLFPHATTKDGCKFCDFESICGGAAESSSASKRKLAGSAEAVLAAFRRIHDETED